MANYINMKYMRYPRGLRKAVTFSYDDGCHHDIRMAKLLHSHGIKCTFNINSGFVSAEDNNDKLSYNEMKQYMLGLGHEVAVHGKYHRAPGSITILEGINDVIDCRRELEAGLDTIVRGMAYPNTGICHLIPNTEYSSIKNYLSELGIAYSRTLGGDNNNFNLPTDWHAWVPTAHHNNPKIMEYIEQFNNFDFSKINVSTRSSKLFYVWGHSFEFQNKNNWELLDEICEKLGGKNDVWYATNIEIYDYVKAYEALIWSSDFKTVYNPTATEIWVEINETMYSVKPNDTLKVEEY